MLSIHQIQVHPLIINMKKINRLPSILVLLFILALGACQSEVVLKNPPGPDDYFVFDGLLEAQDIFGEQVLKVKSVSADSVVFILPERELAFEFDAEKDERLIKAADKKGTMYKDKIITVSKKDLASYEDNFEKDRDGIALIAVFY